MGRPSKLSEKQWAESERRHLAGEKIRPLAREFGVGESAVRARISAQCAEIKAVANQIVATEQRFSSLPISAQIRARSLADELKAISLHLASAAKYGAMTAHKLNAVAHAQSEQINEIAPLNSVKDEKGLVITEGNADALRSVIAMTEGANKAAAIGLNLLSANKEAVTRANNIIDVTPDVLPDDPIEASRAYQRLINGS